MIWFEQWLNQQPLVREAYPSRQVHSVYFDSLDFHAARENIKGLPNRNKIRIRGYGEDTEAVKSTSLEIKSKHGRLGTKRSFSLNSSMGNFHQNSPNRMNKLFKSDLVINKELAGHVDLHPSIYVGYTRDYYADARDIRITLDRDLSFRNLALSHGEHAGARVAYNKHIVEFKFPPPIKDTAGELMSTLSLYPVRSSKYLIGLSVTGKAVYI